MKNLLFFTALIFIAYQQPAHAYLDPGTGSMIVQIITAFLIGVGCTLGAFKNKISNLIKKVFKIGNK